MIEHWSKYDVAGWAEARGIKLDHELLPVTGWVASGAAAAWLYYTSVPVAYLDCLLTNPTVDLRKRSNAVYELFDYIRKLSQVRVIVGMTPSKGMGRIARIFGAQELTPGYFRLEV